MTYLVTKAPAKTLTLNPKPMSPKPRLYSEDPMDRKLARSPNYQIRTLHSEQPLLKNKTLNPERPTPKP